MRDDLTTLVRVVPAYDNPSLVRKHLQQALNEASQDFFELVVFSTAIFDESEEKGQVKFYQLCFKPCKVRHYYYVFQSPMELRSSLELSYQADRLSQLIQASWELLDSTYYIGQLARNYTLDLFSR